MGNAAHLAADVMSSVSHWEATRVAVGDGTFELRPFVMRRDVGAPPLSVSPRKVVCPRTGTGLSARYRRSFPSGTLSVPWESYRGYRLSRVGGHYPQGARQRAVHDLLGDIGGHCADII